MSLFYILWCLSLVKYVRCCSAVCMLCRLIYYLLVRFICDNVLAFVCAVFLSLSLLFQRYFFNIVTKREVWLAIKPPGATHHFTLNVMYQLCASQEYDTCYQIVRFYVYNYVSGFFLFFSVFSL